ncbi:tetrathionate reductase subunit B precursor [archaeon BMS3Bbin15]|nr:tetrathionate reductase subunit B precursor [archaeon BMS3Bbin15]
MIEEDFKSREKHYVMVIDLKKCIGCHACTIACKVENRLQQALRTWVEEYEIGRFPEVSRYFLPRLCNQCENPLCTKVCPVKATYKRADGIVVIEKETCIGCGRCVKACPYKARYLDKNTEKADKCTFCNHRIDRGLLPACVESCVGHARLFGDINNTHSEVYKIIKGTRTQVLKEYLNTKPRVFYIGLVDTERWCNHAKKSSR